MKNYKLLIVILALSALIGCKQNPYNATAKPGQKVGSDNPNNNQQTPKVFSIEAPDTIECTETVQCGAEIIGHVPAPGEAIISIKGLPAGATYDPSTKLLSYQPGFEVVDVAKNPQQSMVKVFLTVSVRSTADSIAESTRPITMTIENKMQPITINLANSVSVNEGETLEQMVEVNSPDFPQGPISLSGTNLPTGAEIKAVEGTPNKFLVKFTPSFFFVKNSTSVGFTPAFTASLPLGQSALKGSIWTVKDVRQAPMIAAPAAITQGLDVGFSIRAEDMNGEVAPVINVKNVVPFGRLSAISVLETQGSDISVPSKMVQVRWDQLRTSNFGTTTPISYEVCVKRSPSSVSLCTQKEVLVTLKGDVHPAPKVDRSSWKMGDLKFIRAGVPMTFRMPITDAEDASLPVSVSADASQPGAVTWKNGVLTVNPKSEGILQFSISAESVFGQKITESFLVEVFPRSWAQTIMLTSSSVQNETLETAKLLSSVDLLSSKFQVSAKDFSLRESCFLTTESLGLAKVDEALQDNIYKNVTSILVSSPLVTNLNGKILNDMKSFGIKALGRLSYVLPSSKIDNLTLTIDSASSLPSTKTPAGLKGTSTAESVDPLILDLSNLSQFCTPLFNLQKPGVSLSVGVTCKATNGRVLTILGFELSDVLLDKKDQPLLEKWTTALLTGKAI